MDAADDKPGDAPLNLKEWPDKISDNELPEERLRSGVIYLMSIFRKLVTAGDMHLRNVYSGPAGIVLHPSHRTFYNAVGVSTAYVARLSAIFLASSPLEFVCCRRLYGGFLAFFYVAAVPL